jgi:putative transposase
LTFVFIEAEKANCPITVLYQSLGVSISGYYDWLGRRERLAPLATTDEVLAGVITEIHTQSHGTYGSRRVHVELALGAGMRVGIRRVERLMRRAGIEGVCRRKKHRTTRRDPRVEPADDLVCRQFSVD